MDPTLQLNSFLSRVSPRFRDHVQPIPPPKLAQPARLQRRQAWRNERVLFRRPCDLCKRMVVSIYDGSTPFPVYCPQCWYSDAWDPYSYGQTINFSQPFFSQLKALQDVVPRISLIHLGEMENSDFTHDVMRLKDCYLIFDGEQSRNCAYGETFYRLTDCYDFLELHNSELCYECVACDECYNLNFGLNCFQCSDSWFLRDCRGCRNCFACANLHQKEYYIFNKPHSADEFHRFLADFASENLQQLDEWREKAHEFWSNCPVRFMRGVQNENVSGDYLANCKDVVESFNSNNLRDCGYCTNVVLGANDCWDIDVWGNGIELCYDCTCIGENVRECLFSLYVSQGAEKVCYSQFCSRQVRDLFGCIGLRRTSHAILNRRYSAQEYDELVSRLVKHMSETGEWGEFPPMEHSPFPYNFTVAQEYFPLTEEQVRSAKLHWEPPPDQSRSATEGILTRDYDSPKAQAIDVVFRCEASGRLFRFQRSELEFYERKNLPLPRLHPDVRHLHRMRLRNDRKLWRRTCSSCGTPITTTYRPDSTAAQVLCERCYQTAIN